MDEATQQNAALVEQAAAASASMQEQAVQLAEVVSVFKCDGAATVRPAPVARTSAPPPSVRPAAPRQSLPAAQRAPAREPAPATSGEDVWEEF
ncbi:hypothetical protein RBA41_25880 [Massilia sp. CCM 9210]|uniref:hypothetical protein n=1 Tax=Massilia scottii TaxID=3057166 RepID=UPI002796A97C|nr:hypothetical protein [Massilia sp. CCM 9210]MDQ1816736.1 hypothetical protein [Massilia sp. CCM 9210]